MRARIIFRGLILFRFETPRNAPEGLSNRGRLTAWLVSDPKHMNMSPDAPSGGMRMGSSSAGSSQTDSDSQMGAHGGMHVHVPYIGIYGRVAPGGRPADTVGAEVRYVGIPIAPGETTLELIGHGTPSGVSTTSGFDEYVPDLRNLRPDPPAASRGEFAISRIKLPHGNLRARDLVSWDYDANQPTAVGFMGTTYGGFVANEAVLDVGDDSDYEADDPSKFLSVESTTGEIPSRLWPLSKGTHYVQETDPNTVEILITNFAPQRRRGVFWSLHYQALFDAAGFVRDASYENSVQYQKFTEFAADFDPHELADDLTDMGIGQPFPYILPDRILPADGPRPGQDVIIQSAPRDHGGRGKHEGLPELVGTDPWARPICPLGQDNGLTGP
jgi:hypothetical protein